MCSATDGVWAALVVWPECSLLKKSVVGQWPSFTAGCLEGLRPERFSGEQQQEEKYLHLSHSREIDTTTAAKKAEKNCTKYKDQ